MATINNELQQQVSNLTIERDNLEIELEQESQARSQSRERHQRRLESDQQVLRDQLNEEMVARIIDNQNLRWQRQGGGN